MTIQFTPDGVAFFHGTEVYAAPWLAIYCVTMWVASFVVWVWVIRREYRRYDCDWFRGSDDFDFCPALVVFPGVLAVVASPLIVPIVGGFLLAMKLLVLGCRPRTTNTGPK